MRLRGLGGRGQTATLILCSVLAMFGVGAGQNPGDDREPLPVRAGFDVKWNQQFKCGGKDNCGGCIVEGTLHITLSATLDSTAAGFLFEPVKEDGSAKVKLAMKQYCPVSGHKRSESADQKVVIRAASTQDKRPLKITEGNMLLGHQPWGSGDQLLGDGRTPRPLPPDTLKHTGEWEYHIYTYIPFQVRDSEGYEHLRWASLDVVGMRRVGKMSGSKSWSITGALGEPWTFPIRVVQADYANEGRPSDNTDPEEHKPKISYSVNWTVGKTDVEVVIEPKDYEKWRPMGSTSDVTPGNQLSVKASLQDPGGGKPKKNALSFTFELLDVSEEPGTAINYPLNDPDKSFDLKFWPADQKGPNPSITNKLQRLHYSGEKLTEATAVISCHDWGAWGTLKVTAIADDGEELVGYLKGHKETTEILLPKREESSKIADCWKEQNGMKGKSDDWDDENEPAGDGRGGDGLTLYEEYRGFYENGQHKCGDVKKKDYFIYDKMGARSKDGIALFAGASGLTVHHEFTATEFPQGSRIINVNHANGPHRVDQHGVILGWNSLPVSKAVGGPGLPKQVSYVGICADVDPSYEEWASVKSGKSKSLTDVFASTVAHELLHACCVWHHGESDIRKAQWRVGKNDLGLNCFEESVGGGPWQEVRLLHEDNTPVRTGGGPPTEEPWIGRDQGQHSGYEDCIMKYDCSDGYISRADAAVRYFIKRELSGIGLCASGTGTGVNAAGHKPQSRYGDAAAGRGSCKKQICVNDALDSVKR